MFFGHKAPKRTEKRGVYVQFVWLASTSANRRATIKSAWMARIERFQRELRLAFLMSRLLMQSKVRWWFPKIGGIRVWLDFANRTAMTCRAQASQRRLHSRQRCGVSPAKRLKTPVKWA